MRCVISSKRPWFQVPSELCGFIFTLLNQHRFVLYFALVYKNNIKSREKLIFALWMCNRETSASGSFQVFLSNR